MTILITGGAGKLGAMLGVLNPSAVRIDRQSMDVTKERIVRQVLEFFRPAVVIHAAGYTDLLWIEKNPQQATDSINSGTLNVCSVAKDVGAKVVLPSSDYVFSGERGNYSEEDEVGPVNCYGALKVNQEKIVRKYSDNHLITRSTMKDPGWKHEKAPTDMWESIISREEYAKMLLKLLEKGATGTFHVGGKSISVFSYARTQRVDVKPVTRAELPMPLPRDCSLNTNKLRRYLEG